MISALPNRQAKLIEISGAGPAGLAAAIAVRSTGRRVCVYERRHEVGLRFHGDFQGLENWTTKTDVLEELSALGIACEFEHTPFYEVVGFDPSGHAHSFRSREPLFYLIRRGSEAGSLDLALKRQALAVGTELRFNEHVHYLPHGGIVTAGPHRADAIAAGYLFETDMADGAYVAASDFLAPKGYAYLLIYRGRGTLAACLFADFHNERTYVARSVEFFSKKVDLRMQNPRRFGGSGNFSLPHRASKGNILYAGEAAGFQDPLFGFGIRWALISGALAGKALATDDPKRYEHDWKRRLRDYHQTAMTNRWFYERFGERGYHWLMRQLPEHVDVRERLRWTYAPSLWKRGWYHLVASRRHEPLLTMHDDCDCTWCRCERHTHKSDSSTLS